MEPLIRKLQNTLQVSGVAIVSFAVWDAVKMVMSFIIGDFSRENIVKYVDEALDLTDQQVFFVWIMLFVMFSIFMLIIALLHLYIGYSARREGRGGKRGNAYLILAGIMSAVIISSNVGYFIPGRYDYSMDIIDTIVVTVIMDLTELFVFLDMIIAAIRLRRLTAGDVS